MYYKKIFAMLTLLMFTCLLTSASAQPVYTLILTDSVIVEDSILKPGTLKNTFTLGDEGIYLYFEINNLESELNLEFKLFNPDGKEVLNLTFNIPDPTGYGALRYPWIRGYIYVPIASVRNGSAFVKIYYYDKSSWQLPSSARISIDGEWKIYVYANGKIVKNIYFNVNKLNLKIYFLNRHMKPVSNVNVRILGAHEDYLFETKDFSLETKLRPGLYFIEIYKSNILVFNQTVLIESKDVEYIAVCNISDLSVKVVDSSNNPLQGATIILEGLDSVLQNVTDSDGWVTFKNLPFHNYRLTVAWYNVKVGVAKIRFSNTTETHILKTNVTNLCVRVLGERNQNLENAKVTIVLPRVTLTLLTDDNGYALFKQIPSGNWTLNIEYKNLREETVANTATPDCLIVKFKVFIEFYNFILPRDLVYNLAIGIISLWILLIVAIILRYRVGR